MNLFRDECAAKLAEALEAWRDRRADAPTSTDLAYLLIDASEGSAHTVREHVEAFVVSKIATAIKKRVAKRKAKKAAK